MKYSCAVLIGLVVCTMIAQHSVASPYPSWFKYGSSGSSDCECESGYETDISGECAPVTGIITTVITSTPTDDDISGVAGVGLTKDDSSTTAGTDLSMSTEEPIITDLPTSSVEELMTITATDEPFQTENISSGTNEPTQDPSDVPSASATDSPIPSDGNSTTTDEPSLTQEPPVNTDVSSSAGTDEANPTNNISSSTDVPILTGGPTQTIDASVTIAATDLPIPTDGTSSTTDEPILTLDSPINTDASGTESTFTASTECVTSTESATSTECSTSPITSTDCSSDEKSLTASPTHSPIETDGETGSEQVISDSSITDTITNMPSPSTTESVMPVPAATAAVCMSDHVIESGDTCWDIAVKYRMSFDEFLTLNPEAKCNDLQIGDTLCISSRLRIICPRECSDEFSNLTCPAECKLRNLTCPAEQQQFVQPGDTCYAIALDNKMSEVQLKQLNPHIDCNNLQIGIPLCIGESRKLTCPAEQQQAIQPGDTCSAIALDYNMSVEQLKQLNPHTNCDSLQIGDKLCIGDKPKFTCPAEQQVIQPGDTCFAIALDHNMSEEELQDLNPHTNCDSLQVGRFICIGAGETTTTSPTDSFTAASEGESTITIPTTTEVPTPTSSNSEGESTITIPTTTAVPTAESSNSEGESTITIPTTTAVPTAESTNS